MGLLDRSLAPLTGRSRARPIASTLALSAALLVTVAVSDARAGAGSAASQAAATLSLSNDKLVVDIDVRTASIVAARRRIDGKPPGAAIVRAESLRLRMPSGSWDGHTASASQAQSFAVTQGRSDAVTLTANRFETSAGTFLVSAAIDYRLEGDNVVARVRIQNGSQGSIDGVTFPAIGVEPAGDASETLSMTSGPRRLREVFSDNRTRVHHDPFERLDPEDLRGWIYDDPAFAVKAYEYPSGFLLHSAWVHYAAGTFGVGIESRDRSFQSQFAVVERKLLRDRTSVTRNRRTYELSWRWVPIITPGQTWESPEVFLKFDSGDWHGVAGQHRDWLESWLSRPVVAQKFRDSLGWVTRGVSDFDRIPALARDALAAGFPYLLIYGWYGSGMNGLSYDFYPQAMLGGEDSLRRNLREARRLGAYPLAWYNGTTTSEITREHREHGRDWVVVNRHGGVVVDGRWTLFDPDRPPSTEDNAILMNLDMGSPAAAFNVDNVRRLIEDYGFSGFEMDQGAKNYAAYSSAFAGTRPELRYSEGVRELYVAAHEIVKRADPDNLIIAEGYSDFINQYVDSTWTFEGGNVDVPLDTYARYSLPWVTQPAGIFEPEAGRVNQAFLMNAPLDVFLDFDAHPEFVQHLRRLRDLKQAVQKYLYDWNFSDGEGFELAADDATAVLAKSYVARDGRIAVVVVNAGERTQRGTLRIAGAPGTAVAHSLGRPPATRSTADPIALELGAYDVNVFVVDEREP